MRWRFAFLGILFVLATCISLAQDGKKDAKPNYYPLEVGNVWRYRLVVNGKQTAFVQRISKHEKLGDDMLARLESTGKGLFEHLKQTDEGVLRARLAGAENKPPVRLLAYPPKIGAKWRGEFTYGKEPAKRAYSGEIQKEETVDVPAGKFTALRVALLVEDKGAKIETIYWFANDIGIVKQTYETPGTSYVLELEKFEQKK